jgi:hypothetical protein
VTARKIYFNSACPVCNAGITRQRKTMAQHAAACEIEWRDINGEPEALAAGGISIDDVRRKLCRRRTGPISRRRRCLRGFVARDAGPALGGQVPGITNRPRRCTVGIRRICGSSLCLEPVARSLVSVTPSDMS